MTKNSTRRGFTQISLRPLREKVGVARMRGFTLIELLIVVIIIGVLAAIALPQYQKAVMKSRFASLKPIAKAVKEAQEIYYDRNNHYATQSELADLDIGIPAGVIALSDTQGHDYVQASKTSLPHNRYTMYLTHSTNFAGNIYCEALTGDTNAEQLCLSEGGTAGPTNGDYTLYLVSGNSTGSFVTALTPSAGTCKFYNEYTCNFYTLDNGHIVEFFEKSEGFRVAEYDEFGVAVEEGATYAANGECIEAFCDGKNFCDLYPTLDICQ